MLNKSLLIGTALLSSLLLPVSGNAMLTSPKAFGDKYQPTPPVVKELTQVIYYRSKQPGLLKPANVYIDGSYHTSLLSGGFSSFCLKPGQHALGAFVDDPKYRGKTDGQFVANLQGGRTYFLRVDEQQQITQPPVAVQRKQGESEITQNRRQVHAYSRARSVVPCVYDKAAAEKQSHYVFSQQALFKQVSGRVVLTDQGLESINELVVTIREHYPMLHSVVIRLTAKPAEGREYLNQQARALRTALTLAAIPDALISQEFGQCQGNCPDRERDVQILVR